MLISGRLYVKSWFIVSEAAYDIQKSSTEMFSCITSGNSHVSVSYSAAGQAQFGPPRREGITFYTTFPRQSDGMQSFQYNPNTESLKSL